MKLQTEKYISIQLFKISRSLLRERDAASNCEKKRKKKIEIVILTKFLCMIFAFYFFTYTSYKYADD